MADQRQQQSGQDDARGGGRRGDQQDYEHVMQRTSEDLTGQKGGKEPPNEGGSR